MDVRRKRLLFRSQHRGTREADLVLGRFAAHHLATMTDAELDTFESLLEENDLDVLNWVFGREPLPDRHETPLMKLLLKFNNAL